MLVAQLFILERQALKQIFVVGQKDTNEFLEPRARQVGD